MDPCHETAAVVIDIISAQTSDEPAAFIVNVFRTYPPDIASCGIINPVVKLSARQKLPFCYKKWLMSTLPMYSPRLLYKR